MPEMLLNCNNYELGDRDGGARVGDVALPPWANSADHFIALHRQVRRSAFENIQDCIFRR